MVIYALIRAHSGATALHWGNGSGYTYALSPGILSENLLRYGWRTFGLLAVLAGAVVCSLAIRGRQLSLRAVRRQDVLLSVCLFLITISPVILLRSRSGIYSYLPGIPAALLFGLTVRALNDKSEEASVSYRRLRALWAAPILAVLAVFVAFNVGYSQRWIVAGKTNSSVMRQIRAEQPSVGPIALLVLRYDGIDALHRFPEGFGVWGFGYGVRVLYQEPAIEGMIVTRETKVDPGGRTPVIYFEYRLDSQGEPQIVRTGTDTPYQ
jgi:hypothetical protein